MKTNSLAAKAAQIQQSAGNAANLPAKQERKILPPSLLIERKLSPYRAKFERCLPKDMTTERFLETATISLAGDPKMIQAVNDCPETVISGLLRCAQAGFEPNSPSGEVFLVPYLTKNKHTGLKEMRVNFQYGYRGVITLCFRAGFIDLVQAHTIYAKDEWDYELGLTPKLVHRPYRGGNRGEPVAYYCTYTTNRNRTGADLMFVEEVREHARRFAKSFDAATGSFYGPWKTDFNAMAKKTVILKALNYVPKSAEISRLLLADNATSSVFAPDMSFVKSDDYIDAEEIPTEKPSDPASPDGRVALDQTPAATVPPDTANQMSPDGELNLGDVK